MSACAVFLTDGEGDDLGRMLMIDSDLPHRTESAARGDPQGAVTHQTGLVQ